jgi:hypothetical protein
MPNDTTSNLIKAFPSLVQDDGPYLSIGKEAKLGPLRPFQNSTLANDCVITDSSLSEDESLLCHIPSAKVSLTLSLKTIHVSPCQIFVTSRRLLAVASTVQEGDTKDIMVNAQGISLHALTSEPERTIYCQLCENIHINGNDGDDDDDDDDSYVTKELIIEPNTNDNEQVTDFCEPLFQALSKLISLNPVHDGDDDDDDLNYGGGSFRDMLGLMAQAYGRANDDDPDDDMICRIDPKDIMTYEYDGEENDATDNRRRAILEHLDNVLVVPEEYEVVDGQFDDACSEQHDEDDQQEQLSEEDDRLL